MNETRIIGLVSAITAVVLTLILVVMTETMT